MLMEEKKKCPICRTPENTREVILGKEYYTHYSDNETLEGRKQRAHAIHARLEAIASWDHK